MSARSRPVYAPEIQASDLAFLMQLVSEAEIKQALQDERDQDKIKNTMKARMDFLDLE